MSVKIRRRKLSDGRQSLFLDIYHGGERRYDFLQLYLGKDRVANKDTLRLAESIRAKRELELNSRPHGFVPAFKQQVDFVAYFEKLVAARGKTNTPWRNALVHLRDHTGGPLRLSAVDEKWLEGFKARLLSKVAQSTAHVYFGTIRSALRQAVKDRLIPQSPFERVEHVKKVETERAYLTIDEIRQLAAADCSYPEVRRAFLFSCYSGLRISDVRRLRWENIRNGNIEFRQQKTDGVEYLPLSKVARALLGSPGAPAELVFDLPRSLWTIEKVLRAWAEAAGVQKHLTFHVSRHTFATLALSSDVDIYTVSKLLGHKHIGTTQIYAKIIDKKKQEAVNRLPGIEL